MVADMPRFSSTGLLDFPEGAQQIVILHVARADLKNIDVLDIIWICEGP